MSTTSSLPSPTLNKWSAPLRTVEEVTELLQPSHGFRLDELKLCWYQPQNKNDGKGLLTKRNIAALEKALKKTPSRFLSLSIGWKHGGNRKHLVQLLQLFIRSGSLPAMQTLESLEIVLDAWIPEPILLQLLVTQASHLKKLHIQATRMKVRTKNDTFVGKNVYQTLHSADQYVLREQSVAQLLLAPALSKNLKQLKSLSLIDCDILDEDVEVLVQFLWQRPIPVDNLNLRSNRHMSPESLQSICEAPVVEKIDLSLCDIGNGGALAMERAFAADNRVGWRQNNGKWLKELVMCGNYQLDHIGFVALCRTILAHVEHWNLSYCDMTEHQTLSILETFIHSLPPMDGPLREVTLQGAKVGNEEACQAIGQLLRHNRTLVHIRIDDPKYPMSIPSQYLKYIVDGLHHNYVVQDLYVDMFRTKQPERGSKEEEEDRLIRDGLTFYLLLNRSGRSILQSDRQVNKEEWIQVLGKARWTRRLDVLYWLLRNCVVQMF